MPFSKEKFEDAKGVIRSCKSKGQWKTEKGKGTSNDIQNIIQKHIHIYNFQYV